VGLWCVRAGLCRHKFCKSLSSSDRGQIKDTRSAFERGRLQRANWRIGFSYKDIYSVLVLCILIRLGKRQNTIVSMNSERKHSHYSTKLKGTGSPVRIIINVETVKYVINKNRRILTLINIKNYN
jgi:hypothetical protein